MEFFLSYFFTDFLISNHLTNMKFIPPLEIGFQIMTLIQEAEQELIIVSPHVSITGWDKMKKSLCKAVDNLVQITFIANRNAEQDFSELQSLGITTILVDDLQAKLCISEKYAIVSSLAMHHPSAVTSKAGSYKTDQDAERTELIDYVNNHLLVANETETAKADRNQATVFERVTAQSHEGKKAFNVFKLDKISQCFTTAFKPSTFKRSSEHVFSNTLLPFADVMIDSVYAIRIKKSRTDCDAILSKLEGIDYNGSIYYKVELLTTHPDFYFIEIIPQEAIGLQKLINDYISFTNNILNSDIHTVLKSRR